VAIYRFEENVAHSIRQLQDIRSEVDTHELELRSIEERIRSNEMRSRAREGGWSKRLSTIATELGEIMSGFWR
jgi:hypothetical protein